MRPAPFDYVRPKTISDAIVALQRPDMSASVLAGGQSMLVLLSLRAASTDLLVDVGRIEELKATSDGPSHTFLGAMTTHAMIEDRAVPDPSFGLMPRVASAIAYRAVRNHGTIGGSIALADPAADWPACLIALNATVVTQGPSGMRRWAMVDFVLGMYTTKLQLDEIIIGVEIPRLMHGARWGVSKAARKSGAFASSLAFVIEQKDEAPARVAVGATSSCAQLLPRVAAYLDQHDALVEPDLLDQIGLDIDVADPDADAYQRRCHIATVIRAIREARAQ